MHTAPPAAVRILLLVFVAGCVRSGAPSPPSPSPLATPAGPAVADMALHHPAPPGHGNVDVAETEAAKKPGDARAQRALGLAYYAAGAYPPAANLLEKATTLAPQDGIAWLYLGFAHLGTGETQKAIDALEKAVAVSGLTAGQKSDAWLEIGNAAYQTLRQDDKAIAAFRAALNANPRQGAASLALGTWHAAKGDRAAAKRRFAEAAANLPAGPARAEAYACLGRLADEAKDTKAAAEAYRRALALDPKNVWAKRAQGRGITKPEKLSR